jgi:hypothetical protein
VTTATAVKAKVRELKAQEKRETREARRVKDQALVKRAALEIEIERKAKLTVAARQAADRAEADLIPQMPYAEIHLGGGKVAVIMLGDRDSVKRLTALEGVKRACHQAAFDYINRVTASRNAGRVVPAQDNSAILAETDAGLRPSILAGQCAIANEV